MPRKVMSAILGTGQAMFTKVIVVWMKMSMGRM